MTRRQFDIDESRREIFQRDGWKCQHPGCYESATELAHHIGQGERNVTATKLSWNSMFKEQRSWRWIEQHVIHNSLNMSASCRRHNDYFSISNNPGKILKKITKIRESLQYANKL